MTTEQKNVRISRDQRKLAKEHESKDSVRQELAEEESIKESMKGRQFKLNFPNAISLPYSYYENPQYNELRRCKLILFGECMGETLQLDLVKMHGDTINTKKSIITDILNKAEMRRSIINIINGYMHDKIYTKEYIITSLEKGCLNRAVVKSKTYNIRCVWSNEKFTNLYHSICYKVATNLDKNSIVKSDYIRQKILDKTCKISDIANLTSTELCPKKYNKIKQKLDKRFNAEHKKKYSELYHCKKCKRNQTVTERRYNRSLDEGVNLMIICTFCSYQWCG